SRSSSSAACTAAGDDSGSSEASSSLGTGRALEKSAASSSLARGFTSDEHVGERIRLLEFELAAAGQFEEGEERGQDLPTLRPLSHHIAPAGALLQEEDPAHGGH